MFFDVIDYFEKHGIQFISANESIDTSTPFGKAMLGIIGIIAELETETTKARTQAGRAQAREKGVYMGAGAPFGYSKNKNKQLEVFIPEAEIVKEIFELFVVQKRKTQQVADYLTDKEILSPLPSAIHYGKRKEGKTKINNPHFWRDSSVRNIIKDGVYIGRYYYNKNKGSKRLDKLKWELSPYRHEPLVDIATYELAQRRILEETAKRNSLKTADNHIYLLSGLLKCDACYDPYSNRDPLNWTGTSKVVKKNGKRAYYYQCGAKNSKKYSTVCKAIPFPADEIEQFVADFVTNLLGTPKAFMNISTRSNQPRQRRSILKNSRRTS
jgi:site-specific DNA recombinase